MTITRWVQQTRLMHILPCTIAKTNDLLTGRGGLVCVAELMRQIGFSSWVERYFPRPGSNRGYQPAEIVTLWMLMLHEGARCLEDVRHLRRDRALRKLLGLRRLPSADMLGDWLRRLGRDAVGINALVQPARGGLGEPHQGVEAGLRRGERLPCGQFDANALYFHLCVTAYNLLVLLRRSLPPEWHTCRAPTFRWRVYALAAKVVSHARRVYLKFRPDQADLIKTLLAALAPPERPPPLPGAA